MIWHNSVEGAITNSYYAETEFGIYRIYLDYNKKYIVRGVRGGRVHEPHGFETLALAMRAAYHDYQTKRKNEFS